MSRPQHSQVKAKTAIVVGGGIAGPIAALALRKAGIDATVYEEYPPGSGSRGGPLSVAPNGLAAMGVVGADAAIRDIAFPSPRFIIQSYTGKVLGELNDLPGLPSRQTARRGDINAAFQRYAAERGVDFVFGKRFVDAVDTGRSAIARFDDRTTAEADILIGCDGINSAVRTCIDPGAPRPRYTGLLSFGGFIENTGVDDTGGAVHMVFGRKAFLGYQVEGSQTAWFANLPVKRLDREAVRNTLYEAWVERLRVAFAQDHSPALAILDHVSPDDFIPVSPLEDLPRVPVWSKGRMVLVGDAAHATSPSSGQGASLAAESAIELARCLRDLPVGEAFSAYERHRRSRVEKVIATAARTNQAKAAGPITARIRDLFMPVMMEKFAGPEKSAWQYTYRIDWEATA